MFRSSLQKWRLQGDSKNKCSWRHFWNGFVVILSRNRFRKALRRYLSFTTPHNSYENVLLRYWNNWTVSAMLIIITYPIFSYFAVYILLQPIVISTYTATCLIIITAAYLTIFIYSKKRVPRVELNREQNHNKLTKTLFIVTLLSLITWTPHGIANVLRFTTHDVEGEVYLAGQFCRLANSYVNPIVYCLQMPEFRERLINLFAFKRRNKDASGPQNQLEIAESMDPDCPVLLSFTRLDATQEFKTTMILVSKM